jgi:hypothetical protein
MPAAAAAPFLPSIRPSVSSLLTSATATVKKESCTVQLQQQHRPRRAHDAAASCFCWLAGF